MGRSTPKNILFNFETKLLMMACSSSEGCIWSTLLLHTLWHEVCPRWYSTTLLKSVLETALVWMFTGLLVANVREWWFLEALILSVLSVVIPMSDLNSTLFGYFNPKSIFRWYSNECFQGYLTDDRLRNCLHCWCEKLLCRCREPSKRSRGTFPTRARQWPTASAHFGLQSRRKVGEGLTKSYMYICVNVCICIELAPRGCVGNMWTSDFVFKINNLFLRHFSPKKILIMKVINCKGGVTSIKPYHKWTQSVALLQRTSSW